MIATLWSPSLNPFESPFPFVLIGYIVGLVAIDYFGSLFSVSPEGFKRGIIVVIPTVTLFLLFSSDANVQMFVLLGLHKYRTFPGLSDFLANYAALAFAGLILTRAFKSNSIWVRAIAKAEIIVCFATLSLELMGIN